MAGTLGGLLVILGLDSTQFDSGLNKSEQQMKEMSAAAVALGVVIGDKIGEGLTKAYEALKEFSLGAIEASKHLYDLNLQTGISIEALASFERVGKLSGNSIDEVANASNRLNRQMLLAGERSSGLERTIKALGIDFKEFKNQTAEEQMMTVAHAMGEFKDGTEKGAAAMTMFNRTGATFLRFLKELDEVGMPATAMTKEMADQAHELDKQWVELGFRTDDLKTRLGADFMPVAIVVVEELLKLQKETKEWTTVLNPLTVILKGLTVTAIGAGTALIFFGKGLAGALAASANITEGVTWQDMAWGRIFGRPDQSPIDKMKANAEKAKGVLKDAQKEMLDLAKLGAEMIDKVMAAGQHHEESGGTNLFSGANPNDYKKNLKIAGADKKEAHERQTQAEKYLETLERQLLVLEAQEDSVKKFTLHQDEATLKIEGNKKLGIVGLKGTPGYTPQIGAEIKADAIAIDMKTHMVAQIKEEEKQLKMLREGEKQDAETKQELYLSMVKNNEGLANTNKELENSIVLTAGLGAAQSDASRLSHEDQVYAEARARAVLDNAIIDQTIALKEELRAREALDGASEGHLQMLRNEINLLRERQGLNLNKADVDAFTKLKSESDDLNKTMSESIADGIMAGFEKGQSFADIFLAELKKQFARQILAPIIRPTVEAGNSFIDMLLKGIGGAIFGSSGSSAGIGSLETSNPDFAGRPASGGGPVSANSIREVNELRPEMLTVGGKQFLLMGPQGGTVDNNPSALTKKPGLSRDDLLSVVREMMAPVPTQQSSTSSMSNVVPMSREPTGMTRDDLMHLLRGGGSGVQGKSGGGPVSAGSMSKVNEQKTEALKLNGQQFLLMGGQGGTIDNNPQPQGTGKVNITNNNQFGTNVTRNELANWGEAIKNQTKNDILRSMRTNGQFSRAGGG